MLKLLGFFGFPVCGLVVLADGIWGVEWQGLLGEAEGSGFRVVAVAEEAEQATRTAKGLEEETKER